MTSKLSNFLDTEGRLINWPSKRGVQMEAVAYLAGKFSSGSIYTEDEINKKINLYHTFGDWAVLRRELVVLGYFVRDSNGSKYIRSEKS